MAIYTKTGDTGETSLFGGKRVKKYDQQIETYGCVDELTSYIGLVIAKLTDTAHTELLTMIQKDLYTTMGVLCGATTDLFDLSVHVKQFESTIDEFDKKLPKLTRFILPQGGEVASRLHIARVVCRRAERCVVQFADKSNAHNQQLAIVIQYLNRLSDLFFIMARSYSKNKEIVT